MTLWLNHTIDERIAMLQRAEEKFRINQVAIEKDWWVTVVLNALFKCSCADQLIFKGGTSLSKGWNLIERFSEEIDLSVNHEFFGIEKKTTKTTFTMFYNQACFVHSISSLSSG